MKRQIKLIISIALSFGMLFSSLPMLTESIQAEGTNNADTIKSHIAEVKGKLIDDTDAWLAKLEAAFNDATASTSTTTTITWFDTKDEIKSGRCAPSWTGKTYSLSVALPTVVDQVVNYEDSSNQIVMSIKLTGIDTYEYHVSTAETLRYALGRFTANVKGAIYLDKDIDLNGANCDWPNTRMVNGQTFDGQGHTIYNLGVSAAQQSSRAGFISAAAGAITFQCVNFHNANIINNAITTNAPKVGAGIIGYTEEFTGLIKDVHVFDSLIVCSEQGGSVLGRVNALGGTIRNCSAIDCVVFGRDHVGSLTAALVRTKDVVLNVDHCFTTDCVVISTGTHSGGFISCGSGLDISDCFTDVSVYGMSKTGVFTGALNGTVNINNCFASGFIEGSTSVGGFIGVLEQASSADKIHITSSYSTALTGLNYSGELMGGFAGSVESGVEEAVFTDCYAAGEVGDVNTVITDDGTQTSSVGGFIGDILGTQVSFVNCYYDKQLTAMRERGVGLNPNTIDTSGIKGVLTTNTVKSGAGLTDAPSTTKGFLGFSNPSSWICDSANGQLAELAVFSDAKTTDWPKGYSDLVKAYSKSSTAGVTLNTWDYRYDTDTGAVGAQVLPVTTYDTVRDITSGFNLTSNKIISSWKRTGVQDGIDDNGAKVDISGTTYDVLDMKHQNEQYLCDELIPGIEWLRVYTTINQSKGSRRVRVIPTAAIEAGISRVISGRDEFYNHRSDVKMYYSIAASSTIKTDNYPGSPMDNSEYRNLDASSLSFGDDSATNSKLYVYGRIITGIDSVTGAITTTVNGADTLLDWDSQNPRRITSGSAAQTTATYAEEFNGEKQLTNIDCRYLISYLWVMNDGRVLQDAKIIRTIKTPFDVAVNIYKNNYTPDNSTLYTGQTDTLVSSLNASHTYSPNNGLPQATGSYELKHNAAVSFKLHQAGDTVTSITLTMGIMTNDDGVTIEAYPTTFTATKENPFSDGQTLTMSYVFYRIVYKNDSYFTIPETLQRNYTLRISSDGVYSIEFNYDGFETKDLFFDDMEFNLRADVVVESTYPNTGDDNIIILYLGALLATTLGLAVEIIYRKKYANK